MIVVTDIDQERLDRAKHLFPIEEAAADGIEQHFVNTGGIDDPRYAKLADIVDTHKGLWCPEAEEYLLAHFISE